MDTGKKIKVACKSAEELSIDDMMPIQGELKSLSKENYQRLKREIVETGIAFPIKVWLGFGTPYIVGGTQTHRTLLQMRDEGYEIPLVPVSVIEAEDATGAMRRVLQDASQYGDIERQGLYEVMHQNNISFQVIQDQFNLPNIDLENFKFDFFEDLKEEEEGAHPKKKKKLEQCPKCGFDLK